MIRHQNLHTMVYIFILSLVFVGCSKDDSSNPNQDKILYQGNFNELSNNFGFGTFNGGYNLSLQDGKLVVTTKLTEVGISFCNKPFFTSEEKKQTVEFTGKLNQGNGAAVISVGGRHSPLSNNNDQYSIYLAKEKSFYIEQVKDGKFIPIQTWKEETVIDLSKKFNVKFELADKVWRVFVNSKEIYQLQNPDFTSLDFIGFGITQWVELKGQATQIEYSDLKVTGYY